MAGVGFKVNTGKTKIMVTRKKIEENVEVGRYPCGVCDRGVGKKFCLVRGMSEVVSPEVFWPAKVEGCKRFSVSGVCKKRER